MKGYIEGRMKERDSQTARRLIYKFICEMKNDKKKKKKKKGIIVIGHRKSNDVIFKTQCLECNPRNVSWGTRSEKIGGNSNGNNTSESHALISRGSSVIRLSARTRERNRDRAIRSRGRSETVSRVVDISIFPSRHRATQSTVTRLELASPAKLLP